MSLFFQRIESVLPTRRAFGTVLVSSVAGAVLATAAAAYLHPSPPALQASVGPVPVSPTLPLTDARFIAIGSGYKQQLGDAYAAAWTAGRGRDRRRPARLGRARRRVEDVGLQPGGSL